MAREAGLDSGAADRGVSIPRWLSLDGRFHENEPLFGGAGRPIPDIDLNDEAGAPRSVSNGIVSREVLALKL
jgi:hypothetical protein